MTRTLQLERYLFQVKTALTRKTGMHPDTLLDGLAHCLTSHNVAVAREAGRLIAQQWAKGDEA